MGNLGRHSRITTTGSPFGGTIQPAPTNSFSRSFSWLSAQSKRDAAAGWGLRLRPEGCAGSSARNSAQEKRDRCPSGGFLAVAVGHYMHHRRSAAPYPLVGQAVGVVPVSVAPVSMLRRWFGRLKAPGLMRDVYLGTLYMDGMAIEATVEEVAA